MAKLLITGGAGFIGSNFIHYWLRKHPDDEIINLDKLTYAGNLENLKDVVENQRYGFIYGDICDYALVSKILKNGHVDVVVNFAAESHNSNAVKNPGLFFKTNVIGTQTLLQAALDAQTPRFHHISTCEVYGDLDLGSKELFTEESPYRPRTPYNASKAGADMAARSYFETFGLAVTVSNCGNNYGPYQFPEKLIPRFITLMLQGRPMTLYRSSHNKREWIHVNDHSRAVDAILQKGKIGETYNIGTGLEVDIETIATELLKILGRDESFKTYIDDRPGHDRRYLLDSSKIRRELGWQPEIDFSLGFKDTVEWYINNEWWWRPLLDKLQVDEEKWSLTQKS